jgi:hypothetical protein
MSTERPVIDPDGEGQGAGRGRPRLGWPLVDARFGAGAPIPSALCNIVDQMREWTFLTNHTSVLVCIARDPSVRLRDIAAAVGITERTVVSVVNDLTEAGYLVKAKDGRRTHYRIQRDAPMHESIGHGRTIGEVLGVLVDTRHGG